MNGSELTEAPLTSAGLSHLIADHNELKTFIKTAFTLTSGGRMSDQYLARLMPNILAILESRTYVFTVYTLLAAHHWRFADALRPWR